MVGRYHNLPASVKPAAGQDNWFDTGDVCTIDKHGLIRITDRSKDVIKRYRIKHLHYDHYYMLMLLPLTFAL